MTLGILVVIAWLLFIISNKLDEILEELKKYKP
jgi:hypothetical protein